MYIFLREGHHVRPKILKQHVAGIEWAVSLILKRIMLSLPLTSADIISRRFVNRPGPAIHMSKDSLICIQTVWNFDMGGDREGAGGGGGGGGGAGAPDLPLENYKLSCIS